MKGFEQINTQIEHPSVDVIVVARNEAADIGACLAAIRKQT
jgi:glycosyltransferase involved in cell wall biosynthesis